MMSAESAEKVCEEKLGGCETGVEVFCVECGSYQCCPCNTALHGTAFASDKLRAHTRRNVLCEVRLCQPVALAVVRCLDCAGEPVLCRSCDEQRHRPGGVRSSHERVQCDAATGSELPAAKCSDSSPPANGGAATTVPLDEDDMPARPGDESRHDTTSQLARVQITSAMAKDDEVTAERSEQDGQSANGADHARQLSHKLIDESEKLLITSADELSALLGCEPMTPVKVLSIVGNTGDGKSYTLNQVFFGGQPVFATSSRPTSCTFGVWVAYDKATSTIVLDTEGMMGTSSNSNQRGRMLLKVLAVSDVIIYMTKAGRLHTDMFQFLSESSSAFQRRFNKELQSVVERSKTTMPASSVAPAAIVFHETDRTEFLGSGAAATDPGAPLQQTANEELKAWFSDLKLSPPEFSSLHYCGTRSDKGATDFSGLQKLVQGLLVDSSVRSARPLRYTISALKHLNSKFDGKLPDSLEKMFPDEYFTCPLTCEACNNRCERSMNHDSDGGGHSSSGRCVFQAGLDNQVFLCRKCLDNSREVVVVPKSSSSQSTMWTGLSQYAWYGYVLECAHCGVIYRSRQHWYGNREPTDDAVRTELRHVWPGSRVVGTGTHNAARRVVEALSVTADAVSSASAKPARMIADWAADQIAPDYWVPNSQITHCHACSKDLAIEASRHHCRACGQGFCADCSSHKMPVQWRGWSSPVRVCSACYERSTEAATSSVSDGRGGSAGHVPSTASRRVGEVVATAASAVAGAMEYPKAMIKEAVRPAYWLADDAIKECCVCGAPVDEKAVRHHCRSCGQGCCEPCSMARMKVPKRGWDDLVRVCDSCVKDLT